MKRSLLISPLSVVAIFCFAWQALSQTGDPTKLVRPRTVASAKTQQPTTKAPPTQAMTNVPIAQSTTKPPQPVPVQDREPLPILTDAKPSISTGPAESVPAESRNVIAPAENRNIVPLGSLTPSLIQTKISEAKRLFKTRPQPTALTLTPPSSWLVNIAALDQQTSHIHVVPIAKQTFLTKGSQTTITSSLGEPLIVNVIRANGVNTALTIFDQNGKSLTPLVIEFPIEKGGTFKELAYYTSAHPALLSTDVVRTGQSYVRSMLDLAAKRLRDRGVFISNDLVDIAERLCIVEHVDHDRFKNENRLALYEEIYSLYALNEIDTYRYSVSFAGAGGMVQMIPWAYNLERQRYPGVGLIPDFVTGMRNHSNALQAMLLYMRDTWTDLSANEEIRTALNSKTATMPELMAAGYNSNAAKLPGYLERGGDNWRSLIPRETQMYLQIYKSFEALVPIKSRPTATQTD